MVGPGTGVAVFRSIIQKFKKTDREMVLVFGCRSQNSDNYYADEWKEIPNLKVITAFSRDQDSKQYVQHKIRENLEFLKELILEKNASIYVSGRAKFMPKSVEKAFGEVVGNPDYITTMKKQRRY